MVLAVSRSDSPAYLTLPACASALSQHSRVNAKDLEVPLTLRCIWKIERIKKGNGKLLCRKNEKENERF